MRFPRWGYVRPEGTAAVCTGKQWTVAALAHRGADGAGGARRQRYEGRLVALPDDADHAVIIGKRAVGQIGTARLRPDEHNEGCSPYGCEHRRVNPARAVPVRP